MKIAIDGPAGAGKSTVAKAIATEMKINYLDTGAMYRAAAYFMLQKGIDIADAALVVRQLDRLDMQIRYVNGAQFVYNNGEDVTPYLRTPEVTKGSSDIAVIPEVRIKLVELQREVANQYDIVMDGRDIGTYVLPDADLKFYVTATPKERAMRRWLEMKDTNKEADLSQIEQDIIARDKTDSGREFAPLKKADDAILIDTTDMKAPQVIERVKKYIEDIR